MAMSNFLYTTNNISLPKYELAFSYENLVISDSTWQIWQCSGAFKLNFDLNLLSSSYLVLL